MYVVYTWSFAGTKNKVFFTDSSAVQQERALAAQTAAAADRSAGSSTPLVPRGGVYVYTNITCLHSATHPCLTRWWCSPDTTGRIPNRLHASPLRHLHHHHRRILYIIFPYRNSLIYLWHSPRKNTAHFRRCQSRRRHLLSVISLAIAARRRQKLHHCTWPRTKGFPR